MDQMPVRRSPFARTPVTQSVMTLTVVLTITALLFLPPGSKDVFVLDWGRVIRDLQVYRLLTCHFVFDSFGELIFGLLLLFTFRVFERQFSSRKFAGALGFLGLASTLFQVAFLILTKAKKPMSSGYGLVFALLVQYVRDIPALTTFSVAGIPLSDKSFIYLLALQLCFAHVPMSLEAAASGILAGLLWREVPSFQRFRFPAGITNCCERYISPLLVFGATSRGGYTAVAAGEEPGDIRAPQRAAVPIPAELVVPDAASVERLVELGFQEGEARRALQMSGNNLTIATNRLLEGHF
eukprot:gb/GEZN01015056.1/.p1 GENE.gb/GEZN01015056.1/~~gb/GEZN01015056.1/.p1  ORF type:complete len:296 (-),score=22.24 gb/GEZN01015056.1/:14-901(-)